MLSHSVQFSRTVVSDSLRPHESQHARPSCPSPTPGVHSDSCPLSHVQLFATPWTVACQDLLSIGILQVRILEWVSMPSSRGSSQPRNHPRSPALHRFFTIWATRAISGNAVNIFHFWQFLSTGYQTSNQRCSISKIWLCKWKSYLEKKKTKTLESEYQPLKQWFINLFISARYPFEKANENNGTLLMLLKNIQYTKFCMLFQRLQ